MTIKPLIRIHPLDNVAVALTDLTRDRDYSADGVAVTPLQDIPRGHKVALAPIAKGEAVIKYGAPIGHATAPIAAGDWVHTHNLRTGLDGALEYTYTPNLHPPKALASTTFRGFRRRDGKVAIRNEIWIIPTVGCVNSIAAIVERQAAALIRGSVEGVYAFPHPYGCSQMGDDHETTKKALCGLINHPNAGGVLVLGLGCENNHLEGMQAELGGYDPHRVKFLNCQDVEDEVETALALVEELIGFAAEFQREELPMSGLVVGLKCGGSDGLSGITANPLVGAFSDRLVAEGGTALLTEVPEMFGAETLLMNRCATPALFDRTVDLINNFKDYFISHNQVVYDNPSPGNKAGGITTLEEKSLGCTQKGGSANVADVLLYGQPVETPGLNLLQGPGNDLVAATAEAISGAHLVLFTTGRGTPFGAPVPTVKISTNTPLYEKKGNWIDFDAGNLVADATLEDEAARLYEYVRALASGDLRTKTEQQGIRDIAIFKNGVTL